MKNIYLTLISILCVSAFSQEKKDTTVVKRIQLNEVFVKGKVFTNPSRTVTKNDYQKKVIQPKNVADLFSELNGFSTIKRGNYAIEPIFRGAMYEQLNIMYDGGTKVLHACPNRMDPITTHIIPEKIHKIEVVKGPFTVRYGATFGGIINMVTDKSSLKNGLHGNLAAGYETNGNSLVSTLQLQKISDKYDIVGNIGYRNFGDYKDGEDIKIPSAFKSIDYGLKVGYNITDNQRLQANWHQSFGRDVKHAGLPMDTKTDDSSIVSLDYKVEKIGNLLESISAKGYYSYVDHLMTNNNKRANFNMVFASAPVKSTTYGGKVEFQFQFEKKMNLFAGVDLTSIKREGKRTRTIKMMKKKKLKKPIIKVDKIWQNAYINDLGIFTEGKFNISKKTTLTTGLRADWVTANATDLETDFYKLYKGKVKKTEITTSGTVSLYHKFSNNLTVELAFGRGVRTPNMIERYINHFSVGQDGYEYLGNPMLKPETNNQFELGLEGVIYLDKSTFLSYKASAYHSIFEDYIIAVINPKIPRKFSKTKMPKYTKVFNNIKNAEKTGAEVNLKLNFLKNYFLKTNISYVNTKNKDFKESLPLNPPFTTKIYAGVEKEKYWINLQYNIVANQKNISKYFGETETKGNKTFNIKMGIKPIKNISIGLACLNVFNETYSNHLNFSFRNQPNFKMQKITEQGRNFTAFVQYEF